MKYNVRVLSSGHVWSYFNFPTSDIKNQFPIRWGTDDEVCAGYK